MCVNWSELILIYPLLLVEIRAIRVEFPFRSKGSDSDLGFAVNICLSFAKALQKEIIVRHGFFDQLTQ